MAGKKKLSPKKDDQIQNDLHTDFNDNVKTCSIERTLEELLFLSVDYKDIRKLKKLRRINRRKHIDIMKKIKECLNEAI